MTQPGATADRRLLPFSGRVAHESLRGQIAAAQVFTEGQRACVTAAVADLCAAPRGPRDRQLLSGAGICVIDRDGDDVFVQAAADGYVGWLRADAVGKAFAPSHVVAARATHSHGRPDIRDPDARWLSMGSRVAVGAANGALVQVQDGRWLPAAALRPVDVPGTDPVEVALSLLGTPYLWGGNSALGIDCSGLVQAAFLACGTPCPGDSDLQMAALGQPLDAAAALRRGDAVFWRGHVALMVDAEMIVHANGHAMAVTEEPLSVAAARISAAGGGPVLVRRRAIR